MGATLALLVAGCSTPGDRDGGGGDGLRIIASFSAIEFVAERVAGEDAQVTNLTPPGADPHALELSGARIAELHEADLVVYLSGLQAATDDAVSLLDDVPVLDTAEATEVEIAGERETGEWPDPGLDPHFWLDPLRLAWAGHDVADALAEVDPDRAEEYRARAEELDEELVELDREYAEALAPCTGDTVVTSHEAFGYLAARYNLNQVGISGVDPEVEPSPARLREVTSVVEDTGVRTVFFEVNASRRVAERLADELGVGTDVLDPMERPSEADYMAVMRSNLDALARGLVCAG
ncbi:metal ABC transporter substrate-binding protein [Phytoactinopolyspora halotolerans]|uniref:Zinc ABC transporter substrate-binding protein n=1 Tax=Phytoactinopolyspora halotolerans TaxID=1981512 RepID=A0A6L9SGI2_9ACTN|nr:metal ABC transporter substrate-binding protein [Phytoactinopolyspora halotolerans]NEE04376.1 zinc ABC transporter substrate-binding protein [Phytoactinopolyspora halotolerans]